MASSSSSRTTKSSPIEWFMANIQQIVIRNLCPSNGALDMLPTSHMEIIDDQGMVIHTSEKAEATCNPMWRIVGAVKPCPETSTLTIRVHTTDGWMNESCIDMKTMTDLGGCRLDQLDYLPMNSILFLTDRNVVVSNELYTVLLQSGAKFHKITSNSMPVDLDERLTAPDEELLKEVLDLAGIRDSAQAKLSDLRDAYSRELSKLGDDARKAALQRVELVQRRKQAWQMRNLYARKQQELKREKELLEQLRPGVAELAEKVRAGIPECENLKKAVAAVTNACKSNKNDVLKMKFLLEARRLRLLWDLENIYPIEEYRKGQYTIRSLALPSDIAAQTPQVLGDERIASALGAVAHVVLLAAKYFDLSLRYPIMALGSGSYVRDPAALTTAGGMYPLFKMPNVNTRTAFERLSRAVVYLERDTEQLLRTVGCPYDKRTGLLGNLYFFFNSQLQPTDMGDLAL